jgi:hypothetical protein
MLTVGPRRTCAALALASRPSRTPTSCMRFTSHVAARAVPQGRHAAGTELLNLVPLTPFGPSESYSISSKPMEAIHEY